MNRMTTPDNATNLRMKMNTQQALGTLQPELVDAQVYAASAEEQCRGLTKALDKSVQVDDQHLAVSAESRE
ncbi:hypothetical protein BGZ98_004229 [Dissophora globulifera]|nr:hypothetical protein BGZ98_004229 [Dissophora globulifera]